MDPVNQVIAAILESEHITGGSIEGGEATFLGRFKKRLRTNSDLERQHHLFGGSDEGLKGGSLLTSLKRRVGYKNGRGHAQKLWGGSCDVKETTAELSGGRVPRSLRRRRRA
jgi:hypothetical protein